MDFKEWYENADFPQRDKYGRWVDVEDGDYFDASVYSEKKEEVRRKLSGKALAGRAVAKLFGGYALKGSTKQKEWAEKIRADKLKTMGFEVAVYYCNKDNADFQKASFWIENRTKTAAEFELFIEELAKLNDAIHKKRKSIKTEKRNLGKKRYNPETQQHEEYFVVIDEIVDSSEYDNALDCKLEFLKDWGI